MGEVLKQEGIEVEVPISLKLSARFERDGNYYYAVCNQIPHVVGYGRTRVRALSNLENETLPEYFSRILERMDAILP